MSRLSKPSVDSVDSVDSCSCKCAPGSGLLPTNNCAAALHIMSLDTGHHPQQTLQTSAVID